MRRRQQRCVAAGVHIFIRYNGKKAALVFVCQSISHEGDEAVMASEEAEKGVASS